MSRFSYTFLQSFRHRKALRPYLHAGHQLESVTALTPALLDQAGIHVLVLDFDGVLSAHGAAAPTAAVYTWLTHFAQIWSGEIFILSNKPNATRQAFFQDHFPRIGFIAGVAKKPYPEGLTKICALTGRPGTEVLMIDDRLLTGILAACLANTKALLLSRPLKNFGGKQGLHEFFFSCLRGIDWLWLNVLRVL
jgi:predicted HAD superfamily phosphohydrolase YqeG